MVDCDIDRRPPRSPGQPPSGWSLIGKFATRKGAVAFQVDGGGWSGAVRGRCAVGGCLMGAEDSGSRRQLRGIHLLKGIILELAQAPP